MNFAWGSKVSAEFRAKVTRIAAKYKWEPSWLMAIMALETARTFRPDIWNPINKKYVGLIQFGDMAAADMGTTTEALSKMTALEQLDYVEKYFHPYRNRIKNFGDMYMAVLWPKGIGKADNEVIFPPGSKTYLQNRGLDIDKDGDVERGECLVTVKKFLAEGLLPENATVPDRVRIPVEDRGAVVQKTEEKTVNPLLGMLVSVLAPVLRSKAEKVLGTEVGKPLGDALINEAVRITGNTEKLESASSPEVAEAVQMEAVAQVRQNKELQAQLDDAAQDWFTAMKPVIDALAQMDLARWEAENKGRQVVSEIAVRERKAGIWDMTRTVVMFAGFMLGGLTMTLLGAVAYQATTGQRTLDSGLLGLAGPIFMATVLAWGAIIAFRFDGTKQSEAQSATIENMSERLRR
jgi:hypothetical protein